MSTSERQDPQRTRQADESDDPAPPKPAAARADPGPVRAGHGYPNEVRWLSGQGHQPYSNQGPQEGPAPNHGDEFEGGNRGAHSGITLEQMEQVKKKP